MIQVWTQREPGAWVECTEATCLMVLAYGGFTAFPHGIYSGAERDALDEAIGFDRPGGGNTFYDVDLGLERRYGIKLLDITGESEEAFRIRLSLPGRALAIAGTMGRFPAGHWLRRWSPGFAGSHAVCVVPQGDGTVVWLDPLATAGHLGDVVSIDDIINFVWIPTYARQALLDEFKEAPMTDFTTAQHQIPKIVRIAAGATIYKHDTGDEAYGTADSEFDADLLGLVVNSRYLCRRLDRQNGGWWVAQAGIVPDDVVPFRRYVQPKHEDLYARTVLGQIRQLLAQ